MFGVRLLSVLLAVFTLQAAGATLINGAGATFPYPLYSKWFSEYRKVDTDTQINYQSIGSGGGIKQFSEKTVDFGATDAPMTDEQIAKVAGGVMHVPTVLGAVVLTYNLPETSGELKLSGPVIADIYLGKITKWSDAAVQKLNPGLKLSGDILVVRRADGSGTSNIFTDYLSKVSAGWAKTVGKGTAVNWPVGLGGKGNEGVTQLVKQTPGSIGYVELLYAESNKLAYATIQNKAGKMIKPSLDSVTAAANGALSTIPADFRVSITDPAGAASYPIAGFTYLLVAKTAEDTAKADKIAKFLHWALTDGQAIAKTVGYSPLPPSLLKKVDAAVKTLEPKKASKS